MRKFSFLACALLGLTLSSSASMAYQNSADNQSATCSPWLVRLRVIGVFPSESSTKISHIGGEVTDISHEYVPELDFNYFFTPNVSAELILATTRHSVKATKTALGTVDLGKVNLLPPTLTLLYHFLPGGMINPYLGAGLNYTHFYNVDHGPVATNIDYNDSWGGVLQAGIDYQLAPHWAINVDVKKVFIKTDVTVTALGIKPKTDVKINPLVVGLGIGYYL